MDGAKVVRVLGAAHSKEAYAIRDFLARGVVEYEWSEIAPDSDCEAYPRTRSQSGNRPAFVRSIRSPRGHVPPSLAATCQL